MSLHWDPTFQFRTCLQTTSPLVCLLAQSSHSPHGLSNQQTFFRLLAVTRLLSQRGGTELCSSSGQPPTEPDLFYLTPFSTPNIYCGWSQLVSQALINCLFATVGPLCPITGYNSTLGMKEGNISLEDCFRCLKLFRNLKCYFWQR